jgi:hypothetical protein
MKHGRLVLVFAASITAMSCGKGTGSTSTTGGLGGGTGTGGAGMGGTGTGGTDAGNDAGFPCGICVPGQPLFWSYPFLVWFGGTQQDAPSCPASAADLAFKGFVSLTAPVDCGTCTCGAPSGSCALPATMTANAASCAQEGPSTPHTPFDPASGWTGTCDTNESIPSGKLCAGVDCVQSLTVGPLTPSESGCTPSQPSSMQSIPVFNDYIIGCLRNPYEHCPDNLGALCVPPPPPGFEVCIAATGVFDCTDPTNLTPQYPETHLVYDDYLDTRACSPCTCGEPSGSTCSSTVSVYTDGACSTLAYSATVDSSGPACHDLPAGTPLGSKSATPPTFAPGACTPGGGAPMGAVTPTDATTFCCIPP